MAYFLDYVEVIALGGLISVAETYELLINTVVQEVLIALLLQSINNLKFKRFFIIIWEHKLYLILVVHEVLLVNTDPVIVVIPHLQYLCFDLKFGVHYSLKAR